MATCTTMTARDPFPRAPTPIPASTFRLMARRASYQSLRSPVLMSPVGTKLPPFDPPPQDSPGWENINVISPSTASHPSLYSPTDDGFRSPRLALLTSNLEVQHEEALNILISPSEPVPQPGDELLYDVAREEKPSVPYFNEEFQAVLAKTKQDMKDISLSIWGCSASHRVGSDLQALKKRAQELGEFEPARTRTVAFVGDTGVISALLDQPYLGSSCTKDGHKMPVTIEYRYRPAPHNEPFSLEVDYLTTAKVRELIEELLRTFRACHSPAFHDIHDTEERRGIRNRSEKAWSTLHSMFRNQPTFTKDFVLEYPADAEIYLLQLLQQWAADFLSHRPGGADARTWSATAFNAEETSDKLDAFVSDPADENSPALWPYVGVVRVYLRAAILRSGLVLADCPSPHDLNFARARATENYLRNCHEIFATIALEHALSERSTSDIVERNGRHRPLRIICTQSDNICARAVERNDPEVSSQVRTWRQQIDVFRKQVKRSEAQRRHGMAGALEEEVHFRDMLEEMEFGLKKLLVERRNRQVATQLIEKYASTVQANDLKVFCVSDTGYWKHRFDEQLRAESRLDLSGIVNLRKYCHSLLAEAQFEAATAFIEHDVPAFLGSLRQWAIGGIDGISAERAVEVRQVMRGLEEVAINKMVLPSAQIYATKTNLSHDFESAIVLPIREHRSAWRNTALDASKEWSKWDAKDYAAFCRHHGTYTTKATGHRNWNEELTAPMRVQLQSNWGFFQETLEESQKEIIESVEKVFDELCAPLQEHISTSPTSLPNLLNTLPSRLASITHTITTSFTDLQEASLNLESDALYGHASSYINTLMAPAYHAASTISPTAYLPSPSSSPSSSQPSPSLIDQHRKELITAHIASTRIFPKISSMIEKRHSALVAGAFEKMLEKITSEVDALIRDLHLVVQVDEEKCEAKKYAEFAMGLRVRVADAERTLNEAKCVVGEVRGMYGVDNRLRE